MKTLVLDKQYLPIAFINFKRMVRLVMTGKVDVVSTWKDRPIYEGLDYPATIILKSYIRKKLLKPRFNFKGVFRRDLYICQYTGQMLPPNQLTVDHVIPKSKGGKSTWENCVTASLEVNAAKGNRTPEEANLKLLSKPAVPQDALGLEYAILQEVHPDWEIYFTDIRRHNLKV